MLKQKLIDEITAKVTEVLHTGPARDVEKNLKATLTALFTKLDLVTREEFDVQAQVLARTRETLATLEARLARLEAAMPQANEPTQATVTPTPPQATS